MKILMLVTDGYGCLGGIAQFNRDFLEALNAAPRVERVIVWPRRIVDAIPDAIPEGVVYERRFAAGKGAYVFASLQALLTAPPVDLVICGHLHLLPIAWLAAKRSGARLALVLFGIEAWLKTKNPAVNLLAGTADYFLSISHFTALKFWEWAKGAKERCVILPCCVDLERMAPGEKPGALTRRYALVGCRTIMTLGRLACAERYKGFDEVIGLLPRLVQRFPDLKYLIVGEGPDRARLRAKAESLGLGERVVFTGRISEQEKRDHYLLADVFALPSAGEGFGIALIEAIACGAPVIGSKIDGSREALLDGALGALVDPQHPEELFDALVRMLEEPPPRVRNEKVQAFSKTAFCEKVAVWVDEIAVPSAPLV